MQSFQDDDESHDKRFEIVTAVLKEIETGDMQCSQISVLLSRICMELMKFKTEHLVRICSLCIEFIQKGNGTNLRYFYKSKIAFQKLIFLCLVGKIFCRKY